MSWMARKKMTLGDTIVHPGDLVPQHVVDAIPPGRLGSLTRLNMLQQVTATQAERFANQPTESAPASDEGDFCPECGGGPYKRLAQHQATMHG